MKGVHKKHKKAIQFYKWGYWWSGAEASLVWFNRTEPATAPLQWTVRGKRLLDYAPPVLIDSAGAVDHEVVSDGLAFV